MSTVPAVPSDRPALEIVVLAEVGLHPERLECRSLSALSIHLRSLLDAGAKSIRVDIQAPVAILPFPGREVPRA
ncbi:MAG TPA: hypothetical protein VH682_32750 [Gemmataceae bacterium]|jgi:hypothetical protein